MIKGSYIVLFLLVLLSCRTPEVAVKQLSSADYPYMQTFHSGVRYKMKGQYKDAIQAFDSCFQVKPTDDAVAFALAQCYLFQENRAKAAEYTLIASKLDPENVWYTQELAYMNFEEGKLEEAEKNFGKLVEKQPRNVDWLFGKAEVQKRLKNNQGAIQTLNQIEDQMGVLPNLSIDKFQLYLEMKQEEKAISEIEKARVLYPDELSLIGTLVDYYFQTRQIDKAQTMLVELVKADPTNGRANVALGDLYLRQSNKPLAYKYFKAGFEGTGVDVDTKMNVVLSFFDQQTTIEPEVIELAEILVKQHSNEAKSYSILGDILLRNNRPDEALAAYKTALSKDSNKFPIWNQILIMEYEQRRFEELYNDSRACSALFPTISSVQLLYTIACVQLNRFQEAIDAADIGKELVVDDKQTEAEFYAQKGEALFMLKQYTEGTQNYEQALLLDSKNLLTKNNFATRLAMANIQLERANLIIDEVNNAAPNQAAFIHTKGLVLFQKGDFLEAKTYFVRADELEPDDRNFVEHLGDVQFKTGDTSTAVINWKRALALGSKNKSLEIKIQTKNYVAPVY